jgi:8-oxo-dGTP diphosphatase
MIISKIGAVIFSEQRNQIAVVRKKGKSVFIIPGGTTEEGETEIETLKRELYEELCLDLEEAVLFGKYVEPAEFEDAELHMSVYLTKTVGNPLVDNEIVELAWVDASYVEAGFSLGSTLTNHVIPELIRRELLLPLSNQ